MVSGKVKRDHLTKEAVNSPILPGNFEEPISTIISEVFTIPHSELLPTYQYKKEERLLGGWKNACAEITMPLLSSLNFKTE